MNWTAMNSNIHSKSFSSMTTKCTNNKCLKQMFTPIHLLTWNKCAKGNDLCCVNICNLRRFTRRYFRTGTRTTEEVFVISDWCIYSKCSAAAVDMWSVLFRKGSTKKQQFSCHVGNFSYRNWKRNKNKSLAHEKMYLVKQFSFQEP
jgi:hypothetical protein